MLLSDIKNYLCEKRRLSLLEIAKQFNVDFDVLRDMLALLVNRGQVRRCTKMTNCGTKCQQCSVVVTEVYEWVSPAGGVVK